MRSLLLVSALAGLAASAQAESCVIGTIRYFAGAKPPPRGWTVADGKWLNKNFDSAAYSVFGSTYGASSTDFRIPDLRGRVLLGAKSSQLSLGRTGGQEEVQVQADNLPPHTHPLNASKDGTTIGNPAGNWLGVAPVNVFTPTTTAGTAPLHADSIGPASGGVPVSTLQPYLAVTPAVCINGSYPNRN